MFDQHPHVPLFGRRQPDFWEIASHQQIQEVLRIAPVVVLLARLQGPNLRRLAHYQLVPQLLKHLGEPPRVARRLNPHQRRLLQPFVERLRFSVLVLQLLFNYFPRLRVQHRNHLHARVEITSYNVHVSAPPSLRVPDFLTTPVYSLHRGADDLMPSDLDDLLAMRGCILLRRASLCISLVEYIAWSASSNN